MSQETPATCYFPNREIDTLSVPCNGSAQQSGDASPCCRPNDACYESGACFQDWSGVMYRQSCTDPSFRDPACPQMCLGEGMLEDGIWVLTCDMKAGKACCLIGDTSCCGNESTLFDFKPGYIRAVLNGDGTNRLGPYVDAKGVTEATSIIISSSQTSSIVTSSTATSEDAIYQSDHPGTANVSSDSLSSSPSPNFSTAAIAAVAVLGTLLAMSLLALIFLWLRSKKKGQEKHSSEMKPALEIPSAQQQHTYTANRYGPNLLQNGMVSELRQAPGELPGNIAAYELASGTKDFHGTPI
ncbi:hypothetical protein F4776DRAFT_650824 [Hypoxylon sp. NC0597]|nr:hypothetical protein F4776DRAFT_650824 [Hypoxylon sp. NC0597]